MSIWNTSFTKKLSIRLSLMGNLSPKSGKWSPSLQRLRREIIHSTPPALYGEHWVTDHKCFEELCHLMGRSWAGTSGVKPEPIKAWITSHVSYPDEQTKSHLAVYYMGSSLAQSLRNGALIWGKNDAEGSLQAAMVVTEKRQATIPAANTHLPLSIARRAAGWWWELSVTYRLAQFFTPEILACQHYQREQTRSAAKAAQLSDATNACDQKHDGRAFWNIDMFAVDPNQQSRGSGREMMAHLCHLADGAGMMLRLDAAGTKNLRFYESCGFIMTSKMEVTDPLDILSAPLHLYRMERIPNTVPAKDSIAT